MTLSVSGLSLATAARASDLPGVTTAVVLEEMIAGYQEALSNRSGEYKDFEQMPKPIRLVIKQAIKREWRHLAEERIKDVKPIFQSGKCFWALSRKETSEMDVLFEAEETRQLVTSLHGRDHHAKIRVVDAAYWMKGCSSLGRLRYAVLLRTGQCGRAGPGAMSDRYKRSNQDSGTARSTQFHAKQQR